MADGVSERSSEGQALGETSKSWFRWVVLGLSIPLSIYLCGQIAWLIQAPVEPVEVRSDLTADYSPWTSAFFPGLNPNILLEALQDRNEGRWSDAKRAMNCFLLSSRCDTAVPGESEAINSVEEITPTPLRIANYTKLDSIEPDGKALLIHPGEVVVLDLQETPILVTGFDDPEADILLFLDQRVGRTGRLDALQISLGRNPEGDWKVIYARGDQTHDDIALEMLYSIETEAAGDGQNPATSSTDESSQQWLGYALDVDAAIKESGLYGWMQIVVMPDIREPVGIDAVKVIEP
jgi:hypothetical protein